MIGFAGLEMCAKGFWQFDLTNVGRNEEVLRFAQMKFAKLRFVRPAFASAGLACGGWAVEVSGAASMVKLREADVLIIGSAPAADPAKDVWEAGKGRKRKQQRRSYAAEYPAPQLPVIPKFDVPQWGRGPAWRFN